jgi:hypothetical protein
MELALTAEITGDARYVSWAMDAHTSKVPCRMVKISELRGLNHEKAL